MKVLQLQKDSGTDIRKLRFGIEGLKKKALWSVKYILKGVNSTKTEAASTHNDLDVTVNISYSNFSKNVEWSYGTFCRICSTYLCSSLVNFMCWSLLLFLIKTTVGAVSPILSLFLWLYYWGVILITSYISSFFGFGLFSMLFYVLFFLFDYSKGGDRV